MKQPPLLRQVLAEYPLTMARVLTGAEGLDTPVTKFGVLDAPDATMFVQEHELVVTSGYIFSNNEALLFDVVKQLVHKHAAAFGVKLERKYVDIPSYIIEYAQQNSFTILSLPLSISWYELASVVFSFGLSGPAKDTNISHRQNTYNTVEYFFSTMKNLVDISQAPKLIHDFFGLACLIYNINDETKISCPEDYTVTTDIISSINEFDARHTTIANSTDLYRHYLLTGQSLLISTITFNTVYFGHIIIIENADQILDDDTLEDALRYILLMLRLRSRDVFELTRNDLVIRNNLILGFITQPHAAKDVARIQALAVEYGLTLHSENYLVQFNPVFTHDGEMNSQHKIISIVLEIIPKLYNLYDAICGWENDNLFFCIIPYEDETSSKRLLSKITGYIQSRMHDIMLKFGVSLPTDIYNTNAGYLQAASALEICNKIELTSNITFYNSFELRNILAEPQLASHFSKCFEKYIKPIQEYDKTHEGALIKTLQVYFEKGRLIKPCADALFVHHNTIRYRLDQISQIAGLDLTDRNTLMMLELCTMIFPLWGQYP